MLGIDAEVALALVSVRGSSTGTYLDRAHRGRAGIDQFELGGRTSLRHMAVEDSSAKSPGARARNIVMFATVVLGATLAFIWFLVVPMEAVCPAIYPAPPGCTAEDRRSAAVTWTIVVALVYLLSVTVALTLGRGRRWSTHAAKLVLGFVAIISIGAVQGSTGYVWY